MAAVAIKAGSSYATLSGTRRSKRVRKGKIDHEITASSYETIKQIKAKVEREKLTLLFIWNN